MKLYPTKAITLAIISAAFIISDASGYTPPVTKLAAKNALPNTNLGLSVANNEKWIIVGEPYNNDGADNSGAVHVYNAATGAFARRLKLFAPAASDRFGLNIAISGDIAICGAPRPGNAAGGRAYLFNVVTGKQLFELNSGEGFMSDNFGGSVSISGDLVLVGASQGNGTVAGSGTAFLFNVKTGALVSELLAGNGADGDLFGTSVALSGHLALVGANRGGGLMADSGAAYLFDVASPAALQFEAVRLQADDGANFDQFGIGCAISGNTLFVGASEDDDDGVNAGAVYLFNLRNFNGNVVTQSAKATGFGAAAGDKLGSEIAAHGNLALFGAGATFGNIGAAYVLEVSTGKLLTTLFAKDGATGDRLGSSVSLCNGVAVIGSPFSDLPGIFDAGSAYVYRNLAASLPLNARAALKDSAPGTAQASYSKFDEAVLNEDGEISFTSALTAPAASNQGLWTSNSLLQTIELLGLKGDVFGPGKLSGISKPIFNQSSVSIFEATLSGPGITAANNRSVWSDNGLVLTKLLALGDTPFGAGQPVATIKQTVQSIDTNSGQAISVKLKVGAGGTTAANDSAILPVLSTGVAFDFTVREGLDSPLAGVPYGEIARHAFANSKVFFTSALASPVANNQALFSFTPGGARSTIIRRGEPLPGVAVATLSSIIGETASVSDAVLFTGTMNPATGITSANNMGLWSNHTGLVTLVAQKGAAVPAMPGLVWDKILNYWGMNPGFGGGQVLFLASVKGPGVTAANDLCLWLLQEDGSYSLLLRESDTLGDSATGSIGTIQRVVAHSLGGGYAVLASLTKSASDSNLVLLTGQTNIGSPTQKVLRRPVVALRKGVPYNDGYSSQTTIKSIAIPATTAEEATGARGKGLGEAINLDGEMTLLTTFTDGSTLLMTGRP